MRNILITLTGPSASGKTSMASRLEHNGLYQHGPYRRVVSTTTRPMRAGEKPSAYNFVTPNEFHALDRSGALLESTRFASHRYGAQRSEFEDRWSDGLVPVFVCDFYGPCNLRELLPTTYPNVYHIAVYNDTQQDPEYHQTVLDRFATRISNMIKGGRLLDQVAARLGKFQLELRQRNIMVDFLIQEERMSTANFIAMYMLRSVHPKDTEQFFHNLDQLVKEIQNV